MCVGFNQSLTNQTSMEMSWQRHKHQLRSETTSTDVMFAHHFKHVKSMVSVSWNCVSRDSVVWPVIGAPCLTQWSDCSGQMMFRNLQLKSKTCQRKWKHVKNVSKVNCICAAEPRLPQPSPVRLEWRWHQFSRTRSPGEKACLEPASLAVGPTTEGVIKADRPCHTSAQRAVPTTRSAVQLLLVEPCQIFKGWLMNSNG